MYGFLDYCIYPEQQTTRNELDEDDVTTAPVDVTPHDLDNITTEVTSTTERGSRIRRNIPPNTRKPFREQAAMVLPSSSIRTILSTPMTISDRSTAAMSSSSIRFQQIQNQIVDDMNDFVSSIVSVLILNPGSYRLGENVTEPTTQPQEQSSTTSVTSLQDVDSNKSRLTDFILQTLKSTSIYPAVKFSDDMHIKAANLESMIVNSYFAGKV